MAEEEVQEQNAKEAKGGKGKLIIGAVLVVVLAGGAFMFLGGGGEEVAEASEPVEGVVVDGATMTIALNEEIPVFARVSFALVLAEGAETAEVGKRVQLLQDSALTLITGYRSAELKTAEGLDRLRGDLTASAHEIWDPTTVIRVVLTEVIVQ